MSATAAQFRSFIQAGHFPNVLDWEAWELKQNKKNLQLY